MLKLISEGSNNAAAKGFDVAMLLCGAGRDSASMLAIWVASSDIASSHASPVSSGSWDLPSVLVDDDDLKHKQEQTFFSVLQLPLLWTHIEGKLIFFLQIEYLVELARRDHLDLLELLRCQILFRSRFHHFGYRLHCTTQKFREVEVQIHPNLQRRHQARQRVIQPPEMHDLQPVVSLHLLDMLTMP